MSTELLTTLEPGDSLRVEYPSVYVDRVCVPDPDPESVTFVFVTDPHVGRLNTYAPDEPQILIDAILALDPAFVIVNGDNTENGTLAEMQAFVDLWDTDTLLYFLPGNHDEDKLDSDPPPNSYPHYTALINKWQFAFDTLSYRLIGFTSHLKRDEPFKGFAYLDADTKTFLNTEAANLDGKTPLLFTHFPVHDIFGSNIRDYAYPGGGTQSGQKNIFDLFFASSGGLLFTGHRHVWWKPANPERFPYYSLIVPGLTEVNGPCFAYDAGNVDGGYNVVTLTPESVHVATHRARPPYDVLTEFTL